MNHQHDPLPPVDSNVPDQPRRRLREPIIMHLAEQHARGHRRPIDQPAVAASVRRLIDEQDRGG